MNTSRHTYSKPSVTSWKGRSSGEGLYLHEKIRLVDLEDARLQPAEKTIALLGYACDTGVRRNQGRPGAKAGPDAIRAMLGRMPNHLGTSIQLWDTGTISCPDEDLETAQLGLQLTIARLLDHQIFPIVLGGSHDLAYGHFKGIRQHLGKDSRIGIINFDAHFDLRSNAEGANSGTPFYQLAMEAKSAGQPFSYLCLGIRRDANDRQLFETAGVFGVHYVEREDFSMQELTTVQMGLLGFIDQVDFLYVSIDLDGFSSAFAPGVSSPSPMGFSPDIVLEALKILLGSGKVAGLDVVELNPQYDLDHRTARLAAALLHEVMHRWALL